MPIITREMLIIGAIRIAGSLPVLRWPLAGAILAIVIDFSDLFFMGWIDAGGLGDYQHFDKAMDLVYMATFLFVALRWRPWARRVAIALFVYRIVGVIAFEVVGDRAVLLAFPNLFEFWFVMVAALLHWRPQAELTGRQTAGALAVLLAAKETQEYVIHGAKWLDQYVATEVAADLWRWIVERIGGMMSP